MRATVSLRVVAPLLTLALLVALAGGAVATRSPRADARGSGPLAIAGIQSPSPVSDTRPPRSPRPGQVVASAPAQTGASQRPTRSDRPLNSSAAAASAGVVASDTALAASQAVQASASAEVVASADVVASNAAVTASLAAQASASSSARAANRAPMFVPAKDRYDRGGPGQRTVDIRDFVTDPDGDALVFTLVGGNCPSISPGLGQPSDGIYVMEIPTSAESCDFSFGASDGVNAPAYATIYFVNTEYTGP